MSTISYQPLDRSKQEIRLIVLEDMSTTDNGSNMANAPPKCQMIITSLDLYKERRGHIVAHGANKLVNAFARTFLEDQPYSKDFYALSYVWGDPAAVCDVEINGTATKIGANLYAALQTIRRNTKFRVIWVDALCINQSDNAEKSWQVRQMAAIYSRARATISWLGPSSEDSDLALKTLVTLGEIPPVINRVVENAQNPQDLDRVQPHLISVVRDEYHWNAIQNLSTRPYWSRIWIFQEIFCARETYFVCGDSIARGIDRPLGLLAVWQAKGFERHGKLLNPYCVSMIKAVQIYRHIGRPGTPLLEMLIALSTLSTTELRDKIYAPLTIPRTWEEYSTIQLAPCCAAVILTSLFWQVCTTKPCHCLHGFQTGLLNAIRFRVVSTMLVVVISSEGRP